MAGNFIPGLGASAPGRPGGIIPSGLGDCSGIVTSGLKTGVMFPRRLGNCGGIIPSGLKTGGGMFPSGLKTGVMFPRRLGNCGGIIPSGLGDCSGIVTSGLKTGGIVTSGLKTGGGMFPSSGIMEDFFQFCDDKKAVGPPDKPGPCIGPEEGKVLGTPIGHGQFRLYQVGFCRPTRT